MRRAIACVGSTISMLALFGAGPAQAMGKPSKTVTASFSSGTGSGSEDGTTTVTATVNRVGQTAKCASTVHWATSDDTATSPGDFTASSGDLNFAKGQTSQTITIGLANDNVPESDELFTITLSAPAAPTCKGGITANLGTNVMQTVTIDDFDLDLTVPAGQTVQISNILLGGCDLLNVHLLTSTDVDEVIGANVGECDGVTPPTATWKNTTADPVVIRLSLVDVTCERTYFSDTVSYNDETSTAGTVNHASVVSVGDPGNYQVDIADSGGGCADEDTLKVPAMFDGNFSAHVLIYTAPVPSDGIVTLQPGEQAVIDYVGSGCNAIDFYYVIVGLGATTFGGVEFPVCSASGDVTVGNPGDATLPIDLKLAISDETCETFYLSDGTGDADHAIAFEEDPMSVDIADAGGDCEFAGATREPAPGEGNLSATITIEPIPT